MPVVRLIMSEEALDPSHQVVEVTVTCLTAGNMIQVKEHPALRSEENIAAYTL